MKKLWDNIQYGLLMGMCHTVGRLPDWFLYHVLEAQIYFVLRYVVRYRREVVRRNLSNSFREKTAGELRAIEKGFYHNLSEVFVDTIKLATISREKILERMVFRNVEHHERKLQGRSWIAAMSHFGSWELTINYACLTDHRMLAVYRPLHSAAFDRFYHKVRSRFGTQPVAMNSIYKEVFKAHRAGAQPVGVALIADQTPPFHEIHHWYRFLEQDTPFFSGFEKLALRFHMPVFFMYVRKVAPRHYEAEFEMIYDGEETVSEYEITQRYVVRLEAMIRETPELWMWSHRRWKHRRKEKTQGKGQTKIVENTDFQRPDISSAPFAAVESPAGVYNTES